MQIHACSLLGCSSSIFSILIFYSSAVIKTITIVLTIIFLEALASCKRIEVFLTVALDKELRGNSDDKTENEGKSVSSSVSVSPTTTTDSTILLTMHRANLKKKWTLCASSHPIY